MRKQTTTNTHAPVTATQLKELLKNKAILAAADLQEKEFVDAMDISDTGDESEDEDSEMEVDLVEDVDDDDVSLQIDSEDEAELEAQRIHFNDGMLAAARMKCDGGSICTSNTNNDNNSVGGADVIGVGDNANARISDGSISSVIGSSVVVVATVPEQEKMATPNSVMRSTTTTTSEVSRNSPSSSPPVSPILPKTVSSFSAPLKRRGRPPTKNRQRGTSNSLLGFETSGVAGAVDVVEVYANIFIHIKEHKYIYACSFCSLQFTGLCLLVKHTREVHNLLQCAEASSLYSRKSSRKKADEAEELSEFAIKQEPVSTNTRDLTVCGKLMVINRRTLRSNCGFCEGFFQNIELFEEHLRTHDEIYKGNGTEVEIVMPKAEPLLTPKLVFDAQELPLTMVEIPRDVELVAVESQQNKEESKIHNENPKMKIIDKLSAKKENEAGTEMVGEVMASVVQGNKGDKNQLKKQSEATKNVAAHAQLVKSKKRTTSKRGRRRLKKKSKKEKSSTASTTTPECSVNTDAVLTPKRGRKPKHQESSIRIAPSTITSTSSTTLLIAPTAQKVSANAIATESQEIKEETLEANEAANEVKQEELVPALPLRRTRKTKSFVDYAVDIKDEDDDDDANIVSVGRNGNRSSSEYSPSSNSNSSPVKEKRERLEAVINAATKMLLVTSETTPDGSTRYVCNICTKSFNKLSRMQDHQRLHTGEKPFVCAQCGRAFRLKMRLSEHMLRHRAEKAFKCELCQLPVSTKQDLSLHMRHHKEDRRYKCDVCEKAFVRSSDLAIHVRIHTGEKPFSCDFCGKAFRARQNLIVHRRSHVGDKPIKCELCEKRFSRKIDLRVHMRKHTGEKPYKCEVCSRGYSSRVNMHRHMEREHIKGERKKKPGRKAAPKNLKQKLVQQEKMIEELTRRLSEQGLPGVTQQAGDHSKTSNKDYNTATIAPLKSSPSLQTEKHISSDVSVVADAGAGCDSLIQQVSVTVSMQVEQVSDASKVSEAVAKTVVQTEKENEHTSQSPPLTIAHGKNSKTPNRKITSYFTVVGQQAEI